jgi:imidazolonepropionase-like amidohydrolase
VIGIPPCNPEKLNSNNPEAIHAGWLLDGTGAPARRNVRIRIDQGFIQSMRPADPPSGKDRSGVLDLTGHTVMPALIDSHVHLFLSGTGPPELRRRQLEAEFDAAIDWIRSHARACLQCGIAAVRDGGDRRALALRFRRNHEMGNAPLHIRAAGWAWHREGRYGRFIGRSVPEGSSLSGAIRADDSDADHIKIIQSGINSLRVFGRVGPAQFSLPEMREAVIAAAERGLDAMVHANGEAAVRMALQAGCRSLEHGYFMGEENLRRMAERKIFWVPTAGAMLAYTEAGALGGNEAEVSARTLEHQLGQMARAGELGVPIAVGTDAGSPGVEHGRALRRELDLLIQAGFSIEAAVCCASRNGARLLRLSTLGSLRPGKRASLIAVPGGVAALPGSLRAISLCIYDGVVWGSSVKDGGGEG